VEPGYAIRSPYFAKLGEVLQAVAVARGRDVQIAARPLGRDFVVALVLARVRKHHDHTVGAHE
jgi:hypothetical protein